MTKAKISEYSATAGDNTDVNSVNIAEGCAPSGINNAIREVMAALKRFETGADGDSVTVGGNLVVSGSATLATTAISSADINAGTIDGTTIGGSTPAAGTFTTLSSTGNTTLGDASGDSVTINASTVSTPNGLNFDSNTFVIDAANNRVGIGTSGPTTPLDVQYTDATVYASTSAPTYGIQELNTSSTDGSMGGIRIGARNAAGQTASHFLGTISTSTNYNGDFVIQQRTGSSTYAERMRIDSSGNVGIGTSSPAVNLNVVGTTGIRAERSGGASITMVAGSSGEARLDTSIASRVFQVNSDASISINATSGVASGDVNIDSSGNVGIGTSSPAGKLHVEGSSSNEIQAIFKNTEPATDTTLALKSTGSSYSYAGVGSNTAWYYGYPNAAFGTDAAGVVSFVNNGSERMRITSAGEVLVGGTTEISSNAGCMTIQRSNTVPIINMLRNDAGISANDSLGDIRFYGADTTGNVPTQHATIAAIASGTHSAGDNPTDLVFYVTADNTETTFEALRIKNTGTLDSQDTYDNTQTGSTVVVTSAGLIGRTSSSIKYKKDVETLDADLVSNAIANLRPVWYRTKDAKGDDKETWSHIGLIAEEVHEVEPRLVRYRTEKVEFVDVEEEVTKIREVSPAVTDEEGNVVQEAVTEEYTETVTRKEKQKTPLETPEPEDVDYGRLAVLCLAKIQEQDKTIAALEARIAALEGN